MEPRHLIHFSPRPSPAPSQYSRFSFHAIPVIFRCSLFAACLDFLTVEANGEMTFVLIPYKAALLVGFINVQINTLNGAKTCLIPILIY